MIAVLFGLVESAQPQDRPTPVLLAEHGALQCEVLLLSLDSFYADLDNNRGSTGLISIATIPEKRRDGVFQKVWIERYTRFRGFDLSRFKIVRTKTDVDMRISFWRNPAGVAEPALDIDDSYKIHERSSHSSLRGKKNSK
jgi:hypothetical protein